jgi:hypothetical protein
MRLVIVGRHVNDLSSFWICITVSFLICASAVVSARPDLPSNVESSLQVLKQQRKVAEQVVKNVKKAVGDDTSSPGRSGYTDQVENYNLIISALKNGIPAVTNPFNNTSVQVEDSLRDTVHFGVKWLHGADEQLATTAPTEQTQLTAWLTIVQAVRTLPSEDRKELLKKLDKDFRWVNWANVK